MTVFPTCKNRNRASSAQALYGIALKHRRSLCRILSFFLLPPPDSFCGEELQQSQRNHTGIGHQHRQQLEPVQYRGRHFHEPAVERMLRGIGGHAVQCQHRQRYAGSSTACSCPVEPVLPAQQDKHCPQCQQTGADKQHLPVAGEFYRPARARLIHPSPQPQQVIHVNRIVVSTSSPRRIQQQTVWTRRFRSWAAVGMGRFFVGLVCMGYTSIFQIFGIFGMSGFFPCIVADKHCRFT